MPTLSTSILPAWLVLPVCGITMLAIAAHVVALQRPAVPSRRRRIRTGGGIIMMLIAALMAYALGIAPAGGSNPSGHQQRLFILVWMAIVVLLGFVVALAAIDAFHSARLALDDRKRLRRELGLRLSEDLKDRIVEHREGVPRDE